MTSLQEGESITYAPLNIPDRAPDLRLLHYNDVYHVDAASAEPVGGIARFMTLVNYYRNDSRFQGQPELLTFFSGDAFNPSLESSVTKGAHMVSVLNNIGTDVACVGNHDLDFGVRQYRNLTSQCKFPWLLANVLDPALGKDVPLGNAKRTTSLTSSNGIKIGVIGLGEREWLATINSLPPDLQYLSASTTAKQLAPKLKEEGAEIIIALTHQREPNDNKLAKNVGRNVIDFVLGGHDHYYGHSIHNGTHVLRSGTDFKQLSYIECWKKQNPEGWDYRVTRRDVVSSIHEDEVTLEVVDDLTRELKARLEKSIGWTLTPLDARFTTVRTKESNIGNFVCDLMRYYYNTEACIMAAGTIRGDQIYPPGVIKMKDIMKCFPFEDPVVVLICTGQALLAALENSVRLYPALEGRFPQVSNIEFTFDQSKPSNSRIVPGSVTVAGTPLDLTRKYRLATRGYMGRGKDGFDSLLVQSEGGECEEIVNEENGVLISTILRQYFMSLRVIGKWKMWGNNMERHWLGVNQKMQSSSPVCESKESKELATGAIEVARRAIAKTKIDKSDEPAVSDSESDYDTDSDNTSSTSNHQNAAPHEAATNSVLQPSEHEVKLYIVRKAVRKWRRLAGLQGESSACDSIDEADFHTKWTKAIAPKVEGRIKMIGQEVKGHADK